MRSAPGAPAGQDSDRRGRSSGPSDPEFRASVHTVAPEPD